MPCLRNATCFLCEGSHYTSPCGHAAPVALSGLPPTKNKSQNESKKVDTTRSVFNSNLQPQRVSAQFLIISYLILAEKRSGSIWSCDIVAVGSRIVSWPSVQSELHAPRSLSSIYSLVHPPNYRWEGIVADTFHLCSRAGLHKARLSCKTTLWILDKPSGLYRLYSGTLCLPVLTNARTTVVWHMTVFQIVHSSDAHGKHFNPSKQDFSLNGSAAVTL